MLLFLHVQTRAAGFLQRLSTYLPSPRMDARDGLPSLASTAGVSAEHRPASPSGGASVVAASQPVYLRERTRHSHQKEEGFEKL
jgi:hypothetical protein